MADSPQVVVGDQQISVVQFHADIDQLRQAHQQLLGNSNDVDGRLKDLDVCFAQVADNWRAPSFKAFSRVLDQFTKAESDLRALLAESLDRMGKAIDRYVLAEQTNTAAYTPQ